MSEQFDVQWLLTFATFFAVSSVLFSSRAADTDILNRCCGFEMLVLMLVGLVLAIALYDIVG